MFNQSMYGTAMYNQGVVVVVLGEPILTFVVPQEPIFVVGQEEAVFILPEERGQ